LYILSIEVFRHILFGPLTYIIYGKLSLLCVTEFRHDVETVGKENYLPPCATLKYILEIILCGESWKKPKELSEAVKEDK